MGELFKVGTSRPISHSDLTRYEDAQLLQALQRVPVLQESTNPHHYLFFALFDGTGQDADDQSQIPTNIGVLATQLYTLRDDPRQRIGVRYVEGIGTQHNPLARTYDGLVAHTWDDKIERAYRALAVQAKVWRAQDPDADIRIIGVGYSRGAVLTAGLMRLVDRHGIVDPEDLGFGRDVHGNITVESSRPPLVQPGHTAQAAALLDPVATNMPAHFDARLPPSVISRFAMAAADEQRTAFPHQVIVAPGISDDRRAVNVLLPGGHANVGGGNRDSGLEVGAFNALVDYLNGLRDEPAFAYRPLPDDPALYTVLQVRGPTAVPGLDGDGLRDLRVDLARCKIVDPCRNAEPVDERLADRFEYRALQPRAPLPGTRLALGVSGPDVEGSIPLPAHTPPSDPAHADHPLLLQIRAGVRAIDGQVGKSYDESSERLSRSLLAASRDDRVAYPGRARAALASTALEHVDHVVMGLGGRHAFAVQGRLDDPAHRRVHVDIATAIQTPVERSDARLDVANREIAQQLAAAQREAPARGADETRGGPGL